MYVFLSDLSFNYLKQLSNYLIFLNIKNFNFQSTQFMSQKMLFQIFVGCLQSFCMEALFLKKPRSLNNKLRNFRVHLHSNHFQIILCKVEAGFSMRCIAIADREVKIAWATPISDVIFFPLKSIM